MTNNEEQMFNNVDYILVVNKDFEIVYQSRFDPRMGNHREEKRYRNLFELYPTLGRDNSSIAKTMSTGATVFQAVQEFADIYDRVYVTQNTTLPIFHEGQVVGVVELTKDLTTVGHVEAKKKYLNSSARNQGFHTNQETLEKITFDHILTKNGEILSAIERAKTFAQNRNPTLVYGETGTGKELFSQAIINYAANPRQKIVIQNCAAVPESLIESILFGATKGSYTGAENRKGLFEEADGGFFFLDELNALPYHVQGKLLRVVQDGTFRPVGAGKEKKVDVKIVAAMNMDPMEAIEKKLLRKDLFYRLSGNMIYIPPLRERPEDIEYMIDHYVNYFNELYGKRVKGISHQLREFFLACGWEGNVRELKHVMEAMVSMTQEEILPFSELPIYLSGKNRLNENDHSIGGTGGNDDEQIVVDVGENHYDLRLAVEKVERELIQKVLARTQGNKTKAGEILGIPRQTLKYKMSKLKLKEMEKQTDGESEK